MSQNASFYRKIAYLAALAVLSFPIARLGAPSTERPDRASTSDDQGGKLAQLRKEYKLGQADLGAIDPASETIRLATLGLRGVAVSLLWTKANYYKMTEDWTAFQSTLEQLARLQPYFIKVWQFQAWNLTYNVSVESDDVRDRFYYVKQGIKYLKDGIKYNQKNGVGHPTLLADLGWFNGNKVGRADEHELYRKLYKADSDNVLFSEETPPDKRDNWLVSKAWYEQAIRAIDDNWYPIGTKNPVTFFDSTARSQMNYGEAIETEGVFGPRAQASWQEGGRLWQNFGNREMKVVGDLWVRMNDLPKYEAELRRLQGELDGLSPDLASRMQDEERAKLTAEQKKALEAPPETTDAETVKLRDSASEALNITLDKMAERIAKDDPAKASQARQIAARIREVQERVRLTQSNKDVSNYDYWKVRCDLEQSHAALKARELSHEAKRLFQEEADLEGAKKKYEQSFDLWAEALEQFPEMGIDSPTGSDIMDFVNEYNRVLEQMDLRLSDKDVMSRFPLWRLVEANDGERRFAEDLDVWHAKSPGGGVTKTLAPQDRGAASLLNPAEAYADPARP